MRRVLLAVMVTAAVVVLLARFHTHLPTRLHPDTVSRPRPRSASLPPGVRVATSPPMMTPFSLVQVRVVLTHGRLTDVQTVALTGDGPHTQALNARAEPILRREALQAHGSRIDVVTGATYTSRVWIKSLRAAIEKARRG